jgi:hypothetical protein
VSYARQAPHPAPHNGRTGTAYLEATQVVRQRAQAGEPCYFWHQPGYEDCPGGWNWNLHHNHPYAYTTHHLHRLMDGGHPTPDPALMAPAHRACNARDGLRAQNARRAGVHLTPGQLQPERTSQAW